jgi:hypothetical protein
MEIGFSQYSYRGLPVFVIFFDNSISPINKELVSRQAKKLSFLTGEFVSKK